MKTFREYINLIESAQNGEPLAEGVMDRLRRIYMGLVYDRPWGTPDSEFLAQWQREIKAQLGQDIDLGTLARLQQNFRERGQTMMSRGDAADYDREMGIREQGVAEGSGMIWVVYRQETTLYPNGERDHETETVKTFTSDHEASEYADKLNATNRDVDIYYFVRGKKQGVAEGSAEKYSYRVTFDDGTHNTVAIPVAKIFQGNNSAKDLITRHFARKGRTVKDIEMMFRPDSVQEGDQELEETQQAEADPVAQITRLHQELNRR